MTITLKMNILYAIMVNETKKQLTSENNKIAVILLKMWPQYLHRIFYLFTYFEKLLSLKP